MRPAHPLACPPASSPLRALAISCPVAVLGTPVRAACSADTAKLSVKKGPKKAGGSGAGSLAGLALLLIAGAGVYWMMSSRGEKTMPAPEYAASDASHEREAAAAAAADAELTGAERATNFVRGLMKEHRVLIFSKSYCPYSIRGKGIMRRLVGAEAVHVLELDQLQEGQPDMADIQDELGAITGARTVPRVFVDGQFIGGADDVGAKEQSGALQELLRQKALLLEA